LNKHKTLISIDKIIKFPSKALIAEDEFVFLLWSDNVDDNNNNVVKLFSKQIIKLLPQLMGLGWGCLTSAEQADRIIFSYVHMRLEVAISADV
jgi:hypothetical protein